MPWCGAENLVVQVVVAGKRLAAQPPPTVTGGLLHPTVRGPLEACAQLAGAKAQERAEEGTLILTSAAGRRVVITAGESVARVDGEALKLGGKVELVGGVVCGPLSPVLEALGCGVHWRRGDAVLRAYGLLLSVQVRAGARGARLTLRTSLPTPTASAAVAEDPPRRWVSLPGTEIPGPGQASRYIYTGPVGRVEFEDIQDAEGAARVVAQVAGSATARWLPAKDGRGGDLLIGADDGKLAVVERHFAQLTAVNSRQPAPGQESLSAAATWQIPAAFDVLARPARIRLILPDTEAGPARDLALKGEFVERVQVSERGDPPTTTLDLHLRELIQFSLQPLAGGGTEVVFRRGRLRDKTVMLDPGHGGKDPGAKGLVLQEKEVNLDVALRTARKLQEAGARALLTRDQDRFVDLYERPRLARRMGADIFVSIHCNAGTRRNQGHGTQTFYHFLESKCLGLIMQSSLVRALERHDRGVASARFVVIRQEAQLPAILVELMFIDDEREEALLQQDQTRDRAAGAIVEGLRQFIEGTASAPPRIEGGSRLRVVNPPTPLRTP